MKYDVDINSILALSGRKNEWQFDLLDKKENLKVGNIDCIQSFTMTYNSLTTLKCSLSVKMHDDSQINFLSDKLRVRLIVKVRGYKFDFPMGVFKFSSAPADRDGSIASLIRDTRSVTLYSKIKTYQDDKLTTDLELPAGTVIRSEIIRQLGTISYKFPSSTKSLQSPKIYNIGISKIEVINDLLSILNWNSLSVDGDGIFYSNEYKSPYDRAIEVTYTDEKNQQIEPSFNDDPGMAEIYNIFTGYCTIDGVCYNYTYINDKEASPTSTVNIGNMCADPKEFQECSSYTDLQNKVKAWANDNSYKYHKCTFTTFINPLHSYLNCVLFKNSKINMKGIETQWIIDSSSDNMKHTIREAVAI